MNPHDLLTSEHKALRQEAASLRAAVTQESPTLMEALKNFQSSVQKHFKREDVYYRILDNDKRVPDRGLVHQLRNDHAAAIFTLESLVIRLRKHGLNADWRTRFDNLMNVFLPHLDHEDHELFPIGQKTLTSQELETIQQQIESCD